MITFISVIGGYAITALIFVLAFLLWEGLRRFVRWLGFVVYLARQPLAFHAMQAERDQARASFEAARRISEHRARAVRRMADLAGEHQ